MLMKVEMYKMAIISLLMRMRVRWTMTNCPHLDVPHASEQYGHKVAPISKYVVTLVFLQHAQIFRLLLKISVEENN